MVSISILVSVPIQNYRFSDGKARAICKVIPGFPVCNYKESPVSTHCNDASGDHCVQFREILGNGIRIVNPTKFYKINLYGIVNTISSNRPIQEWH